MAARPAAAWAVHAAVEWRHPWWVVVTRRVGIPPEISDNFGSRHIRTLTLNRTRLPPLPSWSTVGTRGMVAGCGLDPTAERPAAARERPGPRSGIHTVRVPEAWNRAPVRASGRGLVPVPVPVLVLGLDLGLGLGRGLGRDGSIPRGIGGPGRDR